MLNTSLPNNYVYSLPLCLHPEDYQPSGTFNIINTSTVKLNEKIKISLGKIDTIVSDLNFNMQNQLKDIASA